METMTDIIATTRRYRKEALEMVEAVRGGAPLAPGLDREEALEALAEIIETYDRTLRRYR